MRTATNKNISKEPLRSLWLTSAFAAVKGTLLPVLFALSICYPSFAGSNHSLSLISQSDSHLIAQNLTDDKQTSQSASAPDTLNQMLDNLIKEGHEKMIPLETVDRMLKDIRTVKLNDLNDEQAEKSMKIYRIVSEAYALNVRFKPAYLVYDEYIRMKNVYLDRKKEHRLETIGMATRQLKNDNGLHISANDERIKTLQDENESLSTAKQNVYRAIWIIVILVAFCSGALIWTINHRYNNARRQLETNRTRMMNIAYTSSVGEFSSGVNGNAYSSGIDKLKEDLSRLSQKLSSQNKSKEIASLVSRLKEVVNKL